MYNDPNVVSIAGEKLVELVLLDEFYCRRPALLPLVLLMHIGHRRHCNAAEIAARIFECVGERELRAFVGARGEMSVDVTGTNAQHQHDRRVGGLR